MKKNKFTMHRRNFVRALSLGPAHPLFSNPLYAATSRYSTSNPLQTVKLGNSSLETTLLGISTGAHAGNRTAFLTRQDKNKSLDLLYHAYDKGIRFFDCADSYGTHGLVAEAMKKMDRSEITLS